MRWSISAVVFRLLLISIFINILLVFLPINFFRFSEEIYVYVTSMTKKTNFNFI